MTNIPIIEFSCHGNRDGSSTQGNFYLVWSEKARHVLWLVFFKFYVEDFFSSLKQETNFRCSEKKQMFLTTNPK